MNLFDARFPCEHGEYFPHSIEIPCPGHFAFNFEGEAVPISCTVLHYVLCEGGSPVTAADLEGEKVVWCDEHDSKGIIQGVIRSPVMCEWAWLHRLDAQEGCRMVGRLLIPIPEAHTNLGEYAPPSTQ